MLLQNSIVMKLNTYKVPGRLYNELKHKNVRAYMEQRKIIYDVNVIAEEDKIC